jgi:Spy/CpxP family protein refolding chaperone
MDNFESRQNLYQKQIDLLEEERKKLEEINKQASENLANSLQIEQEEMKKFGLAVEKER